MSTKLTLTIEDSVITSAKKYAKKQGKSLSGIIENYLKSITAKENKIKNISPRVSKLMGVIKLPDDFNYKEELSTALTKKFIQ